MSPNGHKYKRHAMLECDHQFYNNRTEENFVDENAQLVLKEQVKVVLVLYKGHVPIGMCCQRESRKKL